MGEQKPAPSQSDYLPFIDWMKFLGMLVIVYGHSPGGWLWRPTDPFNIKQLGVICFVFATGVSLAREHRSQMRVVFNRMFDMYAIGIGYAVLLSTILYFQINDLNLSNYSPYVIGVNVFLDFFPANPTTWYIGMYLHLILLWVFLLRRLKVQLWMIIACAVAEIPIRAVLMHSAGDFIAYMMITNWLTIFLAGLWIGQRGPKVRNEIGFALLLAMGMLGFLLAWPQITSSLLGQVEDYSFPFMRISMNGKLSTLLTTSCAVTFLYLVYLVFIYQVTFRLPASKFVKFFARNTVFVFVVHIPLVFYFHEVFYENVESVLLRVIISIFGYYVLLAIVSEILFYKLRVLDGLRVHSERIFAFCLSKFGITY
jgi:hypothetical protein